MASISYHDTLRPSKTVKNLGWLIRNATEVTKIVVTDSDKISSRASYEVFLFAHFPDKVFTTAFASKQVCRDWLMRRRSLRGVEVEFCGEAFLAGVK